MVLIKLETLKSCKDIYFSFNKKHLIEVVAKIEVPLQLKQIKYDHDVPILSRCDYLYWMKHLKILIQAEKYFSYMGQCNELQDDTEKEIVSCEKLGQKLTSQEVFINKLHYELDKYKTIKDSHRQITQ